MPGDRLVIQSVDAGCAYVRQHLLDLNHTAQGAGATVLILIAGKTKSGKTYFAQRLSQYLFAGGVESAIVECDRYFFDEDDPLIPQDDFGYPVFDKPGSYQVDEIAADVNQLLRGNAICMPEYNWAENKRVRRHGVFVHPGRVIIVDGLFAIDLAPRMRTLHCLKVFVDASQEVRLQRRLEFSAQFCRFPEKIERYFWEVVEPLQEEYVEPQHQFADILVAGE